MKASRAETVRKYGTEIDRIVRTVRKWMTENERSPSDDEILTKCEDEFFGSEVSLRTSSHETVMIIDSLRRRLAGRYGILTELLDDPLINEIMVNGPESIFVEDEKGLRRADMEFESVEELEEIIRNIAAFCRREINEMNPILDARLVNGSRVNAVYRNIVNGGPSLTIRKFSRERITMERMVEEGSGKSRQAELEALAARFAGVRELDPAAVPASSMLREFIGKS